MGCAARTARRRRLQARQGYLHLPRIGRPVYRKPSESKSKRRLAQAVERQRAMAAKRSKRQ